MTDDRLPGIGDNGGPDACDLIEPLVPSEVDLRGLPFMHFYGDMVFNSASWILASAEGRNAMLRLWWHAFAHEVPAGSLPTNDRLLCEYAGYAGDLKAFAKIKEEALRHWRLATDGRLYHHVVAEIVLSAWAGRIAPAATPMSSNASRQGRYRARTAAMRRQLVGLGLDVPKNATAAALAEMLRNAGVDVTNDDEVTQRNAPPTVTGNVTRPVTRNVTTVTPGVTRNAPVTSQGRGREEGIVISSENQSAAQLTPGERDGDALRCAADDQVYEVARAAVAAAGLDDAHVETEFAVVESWLSGGLSKASILLVIKAKVLQARKARTVIGSLAYFTPALRDSASSPSQHVVTPGPTIDPAAKAERWRERLRKCVTADGRWDEFRWDSEVYGHAPPHQGYRVPLEILGEPEFRQHFPSLFPAPSVAA